MYLIGQGANICLQNHSDGTSLYLDDMILLISFGVFRVRSATIFDEMSLFLYCRFFCHNCIEHGPPANLNSGLISWLKSTVCKVTNAEHSVFVSGSHHWFRYQNPFLFRKIGTCSVSRIAHATMAMP